MVKGHECGDIRNWGIYKQEVIIIDNNIYENGWDQTNAYIFGIIMSDGCLKYEGRYRNRLAIRIGLNDYDMIETLHNYMCVGNKIYCQGKQYSIKYRNEDSINFLMNYGLTERKSLTMRFPNLPHNILASFIRGYFDGDGSIVLTHTQYNTYGQVSFASGSKDFLIGLQNVLFNNFNIKSTLYDDGHKDTSTMTLKITKRKEIDKLFDIMYKDANIYLERKYQKFIELNNNPLKYNIA